MQVTFSGIGGRTALVPQKNGVRTASWAFNSNLKFTCKMTLDAMQDVRITETPITRALTWEDEQAPAASNAMGAQTPTYTSNATTALVGLPTPTPPMILKTCNGAPGQFKNGFYFSVTTEAHGKCLLIAYLHLGGLLVRPSVKSFNKNNAVLVHTEMCGYDTYSVSVDIKIPETSSIHKAGPRYSSTHPPFCIKFILWGQDGLIKTLHESMPLYSYAKDPDQVNCQYFSPNPSTSLPTSSPSSSSSSRSERSSALLRMQESPPSSPTQPLIAGTLANATGQTPVSPSTSASPLAALSSSFMMGSAAAAAAISIPMDSFKSLVAYIQKLERQVEMQQQQLDSARQQEELQHRLISQLAQDIKYKSFQCEVLEEKMQQISATSPHTQQTPTGDNLIAPSHLISLNPIMGTTGVPASSQLSPFGYPANAASSSSSTSSASNNALPAFSYPTSTTSAALTPIGHLAMPLASTSSSTSPLATTPLIITNPLTANLANPNGSTAPSTDATTTPSTSTTTTTTLSKENQATATSPSASTSPAEVKLDNETKPISDSTNGADKSIETNGKENEPSEKSADKAEQQEEEVRDFLTQMQKKQKVSQENGDTNEAAKKRVRS